MKKVTVFVDKGNQAAFICPYCQSSHTVSVEKFKGLKHNLVTRCSCQEQFEVELNFRQFFRKDVELVGEFKNVTGSVQNWYAMTVVNLSMIGLKFKATVPAGIEVGHQLRVRFTLDNQKATALEKDVQVVNVKDDQVGCEFLNLDYEKELGFYFLS